MFILFVRTINIRLLYQKQTYYLLTDYLASILHTSFSSTGQPDNGRYPFTHKGSVFLNPEIMKFGVYIESVASVPPSLQQETESLSQGPRGKWLPSNISTGQL